jgi:hypothetical protein
LEVPDNSLLKIQAMRLLSTILMIFDAILMIFDYFLMFLMILFDVLCSLVGASKICTSLVNILEVPAKNMDRPGPYFGIACETVTFTLLNSKHITNVSKIHQEVIKKSSRSHQEVIMKSSRRHQEVTKKSSRSHQEVIKYLQNHD